jgi:succinate dehydrogenase/fumarate reductase cytochrome b subunit
MKIHSQPKMPGQASTCHRESGLATMVFIVLLAIMMILVLAEARALFNLHREVKLLEKQQIKRLNPPATNAAPTIAPAPK